MANETNGETSRAERARAYFKESGYNCAQAVLLAFCDKTGLDEKTAALCASSFGGGIGRLREVCGAFSGACMALGLIDGAFDPKDAEKKAEQYKTIQAMAKDYADENGSGSIICRDLLGLSQKTSEPTPEKRSPEYYRKRPCDELVACAAEILERCLAKNPQ